MATVLDLELATYRKHRERFLAEHLGEHVLIKGETVIGFFPTALAAERDGLRLFPKQPFFVRHIAVVEEIAYMSANVRF